MKVGRQVKNNLNCWFFCLKTLLVDVSNLKLVRHTAIFFPTQQQSHQHRIHTHDFAVGFPSCDQLRVYFDEVCVSELVKVWENLQLSNIAEKLFILQDAVASLKVLVCFEEICDTTRQSFIVEH